MRSRKGFTLVELMVVILIVGILASVAIPILRGRIDAAKWSEGKAMMGSIATAIRAYAAEKGTNGTAPADDDFTAIGFGANDLEGNYFGLADFSFGVTSMDPVQFTVTCTAGTSGKTDAPSTPASWTLTGNADGTVTWTEG